MTHPSLSGPPARRSRGPLWLLVAIVALPVLEIVLLVLIGRWIGAGWTILLLLAVAALGLGLLMLEGPRKARGLREAAGWHTGPDGTRVRSGQPDVTRELSDGAIVLIGALLLVFPGFLTDVLALLCLLPFTRPLLRGLLTRQVRRRTDRAAARWRGQAHGPVPGQIIVHPDGVDANGPGPQATGPDTTQPPHPGRDATAGPAVIEGRVIDPPS